MPRPLTRAVVPALLALMVAAPPLAAQTAADPHAGHATDPTAGPAAAALAEVNARMHAAMTIPPTGDPDADFLAAMIPHHQGAVEMAEVVLRYGSDPEVRALAEGIIAAQQAEIAWMQAWLAARGD